jgi:hypothetical protein
MPTNLLTGIAVFQIVGTLLDEFGFNKYLAKT